MKPALKGEPIEVVPSYRKESSLPSRAAIVAMRRASRLRSRESGEKLRPVDVAFITALCMNGGNPSAAAREVGLTPATGLRWLQERKPIKEAYEAFQRSAQNRLQDWAELIPRAQRRLVSLMDSGQDTVALAAAREILARGLGPVVQKLEAVVRNEEELTDVQLQAAVSLMAARALTWTEAARYVRDHPEEVREWAAQVAAQRTGLVLGSGGEIVDGSVAP